MAEKLEELDFGGQYGKERWNHPELARKWKSWLEANKKNFTSEQSAIDMAQYNYRDELWKQFFDSNKDLDIYDRILPADDSITNVDDAIIQENPKMKYKDITDEDRRKYAINRIRIYADDDNFSDFGSIGKVQSMMDNLYNPATVNNARELDEATRTASLPTQQQNTSPSRSSLLRAGEQHIDTGLPMWLQVANPSKPWNASHPLMQKFREYGIQQGFTESQMVGFKSYLDNINDYPTLEERLQQQKFMIEGWKAGEVGNAPYDFVR